MGLLRLDDLGLVGVSSRFEYPGGDLRNKEMF